MGKLRILLLLCLTGALLSCTAGLSREDAAKIVSRYFGYPKPLMGIVTPGPAGGTGVAQFMKGVNKLEAEGYASGRESKASSGKSYLPTEKSKAYMVGIYINDSYPLYEGAVCREVLKSIDSIDFTEGNDIATVTFTAGLEPIEPVYSLLCINRFCDCFGKDFRKTRTLKLKLHKYEKGWRVGG